MMSANVFKMDGSIFVPNFLNGYISMGWGDEGRVVRRKEEMGREMGGY